MNLLKLTNLLALGVALTVVGTGCKKKNPNVTPLPGGAGVMGNGPGIGDGNTLTGNTIPVGGGDAATFDPDSMAQDRAALASETVYFDYDSSSIKGTEQMKISAVA